MKYRAMALTMATFMALGSVSFAATPALTGVVNQPNWFGSDQLLVKSVTDTGFAYYQLNLNGDSTLLVQPSVNATEVAETQNGSQVAYVNDNGDLYLLNTQSKSLKKISVDNEPKMELQFSQDGSKLYFLMGEKIDKIVMITLADGQQKTLLSDKVAYKSDLQISVDGSKALYAVTKAGTVNDKDESYSVDSSGTEPQYSVLDLNTTGAKPVQVTSSTDNKVYGRFTKDNKIVFVSASADKDGMPLMQMNSDGSQLKALIGHLDVSQVLVLNDGNLLVVGENGSFKKALFKVEANGSTQKLITLPEGTTEVQAKDLGHVVITVETEQGEKVSALVGGKFVDLTK